MTKTVCIIQARLGSTRLPAKVLLPLPTGRTVLEEVVHRCQQINGVDAVVVAIPDTTECDVLLPYVGAACVVRGPEHDVLARYAKAASVTAADVVMRITSDCPLVDPQVCAEVLRLVEKRNARYASNSWPSRSYPHGFDCEAFTTGALQFANANSNYLTTEDREHVGPAIQKVLPNNERLLLKAMDDRSHLRWTLDTLEDYVRICKIFEGHIAANPSLRAA